MLFEGMVCFMLKKFTFKNYKNFRDEIEVNFENIAGYQFSTDCVSDNVITKMLIYGRNATGKTNLGRALMDIVYTIIRGPRFVWNEPFLNADSDENFAEFSYLFGFDGDELVYRYTRFSSQKLRDEELTINGQTIFKCDFQKKQYDFENLKYVDAETANVELYLQSLEEREAEEENEEFKLSFFKWLIGNVALKSVNAPKQGVVTQFPF